MHCIVSMFLMFLRVGAGVGASIEPQVCHVSTPEDQVRGRKLPMQARIGEDTLLLGQVCDLNRVLPSPLWQRSTKVASPSVETCRNIFHSAQLGCEVFRHLGGRVEKALRGCSRPELPQTSPGLGLWLRRRNRRFSESVRKGHGCPSGPQLSGWAPTNLD